MSVMFLQSQCPSIFTTYNHHTRDFSRISRQLPIIFPATPLPPAPSPCVCSSPPPPPLSSFLQPSRMEVISGGCTAADNFVSGRGDHLIRSKAPYINVVCIISTALIDVRWGTKQNVKKKGGGPNRGNRERERVCVCVCVLPPECIPRQTQVSATTTQ